AAERWLLREGRIEAAPLRRAAASGRPVAVLGTALAFLDLMASDRAPLTLPSGSWLLETGGYKGSRRNLEKAEFYRRLSEYFGVPVDLIHNEYGMTEISSPFYSRGLDRPHRGAP